MKKLFVLFAFCAVLIPIQAICQQQPTREKLIGTWKHPIYAGTFSINGQTFESYNNEIFQFKADGTFVFGEYGEDHHALYEVEGYWALSKDKKRLLFTYDSGETSSIDIRNFKGNTFTTTSMEGRDFVYTKE